MWYTEAVKNETIFGRIFYNGYGQKNNQKTTKNPLKDILNAGKHIKDKQLIEYFISIGYKSTFDGKTIPQPVSSNFLKGMKSPSDYYIECNSAMKSVLANFEKMGDAGSWQKKMMNLCSEYRLHPTIKEFCETS